MKYLLIDWEDKTVWQTDDLENEIEMLVDEELDMQRTYENDERNEAIYNRRMGE